MPLREPVLIVLHGDGYYEVFAERYVDIKVFQLPFLESADGERLAERYLERSVSFRFKDLYFPGMVRATGNFRPRRPSGLMRVQHELELLASLERT